MKFVADRMLGRLSRWLRLFGYDTVGIAAQENEDDVLLVLAAEYGRILLSRDRILITRALKKGIIAYHIRSQDIMGQLREMHEVFNIEYEPRMNRCTLCNSIIRKVEPGEMERVREKEYAHPLRGDTGFWICDTCGQIYWLGKHWEKIRETVSRLK